LGRMHLAHGRQLRADPSRIARRGEMLSPDLVAGVALEPLEDLAALSGVTPRPGESPPLLRPVEVRRSPRCWPAPPPSHALSIHSTHLRSDRYADSQRAERQRYRQPPPDGHVLNST